MKKHRVKLIGGAALLLAFSLSFQSCIGSFSLTNKVLTWNRNVNNKFVNELVFFAFWVLPVYEVTAIADLLVINSIEFWSGNNPLEANNTVIPTDEGNYRILAHAGGYDILTPDGRSLNFYYDSDSQTWSFSHDGSERNDFLKFTDEGVQLKDINGDFVDVELSEKGVEGYYQSLLMPCFALR